MALDGDSNVPLRVLGAGSLKAVFSEIAEDFTRATEYPVECDFGSSGILRRRIEAGEPADVFASASLDHPRRLARAGHCDAPAIFARNVLCALTAPGIVLPEGGILALMLDASTRLATSTPGHDPSGDYAKRAIGEAGRLVPGADRILAARVRHLTGAPDSPKAPDDGNLYAWILRSGQADIFLTYRTNGIKAQAECPDIAIHDLPPAMAIRAEFGISLIGRAGIAAEAFRHHVLSDAGQRVLAAHDFGPGDQSGNQGG